MELLERRLALQPDAPPLHDGSGDDDGEPPLVAGVRLPLHQHILELCGGPHTGKTQLCLTAAVRTALQPGHGVALVLSAAIEGLGARLSHEATRQLLARWQRAGDAAAPVPPLRRLFPHAALSLARDMQQAQADEAAASGEGGDGDGAARALEGAELAAAVERQLRSLLGLAAADDAMGGAVPAADEAGVLPGAVPDGPATSELLGFEAASALRQVALFNAHDGWSLLRLLQELEARVEAAGGTGARGAPPPLAGIEGSPSPPVWDWQGEADGEAAVAGHHHHNHHDHLGGGLGWGDGEPDSPPAPAADRLTRPPVAPYVLPPAQVPPHHTTMAPAPAATTAAAPPPLRLLVVDCLGTLLATSIGGGGGGGDGPRQHVGHAIMAETGRILARLSRQHGVSAIVTNSVTAERGSYGGASAAAAAAAAAASHDGGYFAAPAAPPAAAASSSWRHAAPSSAAAFKPALGPSWRYTPDTTVMLEPSQPPTHARPLAQLQPLQPAGALWPASALRKPVGTVAAA